MERERELEHRAVDASTALVRIQVRQDSWIDRDYHMFTFQIGHPT